MYKVCVTCSQEKPASEYRKDSRRKDGLQSSCKQCARQYHKSAYMDRYGDKVKQRSAMRFSEAKRWLDEYKKTHPCVFCGECEIVCLEFHHVDPSTKDFTISGNQNRNMDSIKEEVSKCIVVCRNCHAKIHARLIGEVPESGLSEQS